MKQLRNNIKQPALTLTHPIDLCRPRYQVTWTLLFQQMELAVKYGLVDDYSISQTTLEQVFVNLARAQLHGDAVDVQTASSGGDGGGVKEDADVDMLCCTNTDATTTTTSSSSTSTAVVDYVVDDDCAPLIA